MVDEVPRPEIVEWGISVIGKLGMPAQAGVV